MSIDAPCSTNTLNTEVWPFAAASCKTEACIERIKRRIEPEDVTIIL